MNRCLLHSQRVSDCPNLTGVCFLGNPPSIGTGVFDNSSKVIVHSCSGTSGWRATFAGRPRVAGIPLAGATKDEWGFLPDHSGNPAHDRYWYSAALARVYAERSRGTDFVRDAMLMFAGEQGREGERQAAIKRYLKLCRERNTAIEDEYASEFWAAVLCGGRVNVHPLYPLPNLSLQDAHLTILCQRFMTGICRLRMLDFITRAPLDRPVAVVFGHAAAMNWAGQSYNRVGLEIASALCASGYPTDLIPLSLAGTTARHLESDGFVCLGPQRYHAVVLYQPEFGNETELAFFEQAARSNSALFLMGDWTRDSEAPPIEAMARLGPNVRAFRDNSACVHAVTRFLDESGVVPVTGWPDHVQSWGQAGGVVHSVPPTEGHATLTDGTYIRIAGGRDPTGDPINETFNWRGHTISVDPVGVYAIRFGADGRVDALAAGGLKRLKTGNLDVVMPERADLALRRETNGMMRGVLQGMPGSVPESLLTMTTNWLRSSVPRLLSATTESN
jgi:hypothetical protein